MRPIDHNFLKRDPQEAKAILAELGFRQTEKALRNLMELTGTPSFPLSLPPNLIEEILLSPDPDLCLNNLTRLSAAVLDRSGFYSLLEDRPELSFQLASILATGQFLPDILIRNPQYFYWLTDDPERVSEGSNRSQLFRGLASEISIFKDKEHKLLSLRRLYRRELLRIGTGEIIGKTDIQSVGRELSALADAVLQILYELSYEEMIQRYGDPIQNNTEKARFAIIGLGKLGGQELNFSSDIDIIFVYSDEGETRLPSPSVKSISNYEFFNRLSEQIIKSASDSTREGFLYRVDTRLRPDGSAGSFARSLSSYGYYYSSRGRTWERQMLIKARYCAADPELAEAFLKIVRPFVYSEIPSGIPVAEIKNIKDKIEAAIGTGEKSDSDLKLRSGGIRDIEFIVQCLQLLTGSHKPQLSSNNTLKAIASLSGIGYLESDEAQKLKDAYIFFRRIEHRLQLFHNVDSYELPDDPLRLRALALSLDLKDSHQLDSQLEIHTQNVNAIYNEIFIQDSHEDIDIRIQNLLNSQIGDTTALRFLRSLGFGDTRSAHRDLILLAFGHLPKLQDSNAQTSFIQLAPKLLSRLSASPDPVSTLTGLGKIIRAYGAPNTLYHLLSEDEEFLDLVISLCSKSKFLCDLLSRDPGLLDWLLLPNVINRNYELEDFKSSLSHFISQVQDRDLILLRLCTFKDRHILRIGARDTLGLSSTEETFGQLSLLAETILEEVYGFSLGKLAERYGHPLSEDKEESKFAILALGKLGGYELNFGSDLDLFFIYSHDGYTSGGWKGKTGNIQFFIELSQAIIGTLQNNRIYKVDARLRPEGRNANLAISFDAYRKYLRNRASDWERLALTRARCVSGDPKLCDVVQKEIYCFLFEGGADQNFLDNTRKMRLKIEDNSRIKYKDFINIKSGIGGITDIEFIAQVLQIKDARSYPDLKSTRTLQILRSLQKHRLISKDKADRLIRSHSLICSVLKALRIVDETSRNTLPKDEEGLWRLSRSLGYRGSKNFLKRLEEFMILNREIFDEIFDSSPKTR